MKRALITAVLVSLATNVEAADLDPFYLGVFGGAGLAATSNTLVQNGQTVGTTGNMIGTVAGIIAGYNQQVQMLYWGAEVRVAYDFNRQCFGPGCASEAHSGALLQQVGKLGVVFANDMVLAARFGAAERQNGLCAFDDVVFVRDCGSGFVAGWDAGAELKFKVTSNADVTIAWDHIGWSGYSASTPVYQNFANSVSIAHEDVFTLGVTFH